MNSSFHTILNHNNGPCIGNTAPVTACPRKKDEIPSLPFLGTFHMKQATFDFVRAQKRVLAKVLNDSLQCINVYVLDNRIQKREA